MIVWLLKNPVATGRSGFSEDSMQDKLAWVTNGDSLQYDTNGDGGDKRGWSLRSSILYTVLSEHGLIIVEGFNDVINLDNLGVPALGIMSNRMTESRRARRSPASQSNLASIA